MGCGASVTKDVETHASPAASPAGQQEPAPSSTWATKAEAQPTPQHAGGQGGQDRGMKIMDADDEESEIEVIYEGTGKPIDKSYAANGQEAMELEMPPMQEIKPVKQDPAEPPVQPLSKQQQEEAAKLAEQRKRFDNQRYQRELAAARGSPTPGEVPAAAGPVSPPVAKEPPRKDLVMGLNLVEEPGQNEDLLAFDCLPGGIMCDTPREEAAQKPVMVKKNKHDAFDDDDEMLMKEILEAVDS